MIFGEILKSQFSSFGNLPWLFIPPGEAYIKKEWEDSPFIRLVYLPNAVQVGYKHRVVSVLPWRIEDDGGGYVSEEVGDEEFATLRAEFLSGNLSNKLGNARWPVDLAVSQDLTGFEA